MGGLAIGVGSDEVAIGVDDRLNEFRVIEAVPDLTLNARWADLSSSLGGTAVFDSGESWTLARSDGRWVFDFYSSNLGAIPYRSARISDDFSGGEILLHRPFRNDDELVDVLQFPLAELLLIHRLARGEGVEIHACGLIDEAGRGLLFAGRSGDGKTTTANLWSRQPGITILSDDRVIVRREPAGFRIYGSPWHGEARFAANRSAPLSAMFLIRHGSGNAARRLESSVAVSELLPQCILPFHDRRGIEFTLELLESLVGTVPCFQFLFTPDETSVAAVRRHIASESR